MFLHPADFYNDSPVSPGNHFVQGVSTPSDPAVQAHNILPPQDPLSPTTTEEILRSLAKEFAFLAPNSPETFTSWHQNQDGSESSIRRQINSTVTNNTTTTTNNNLSSYKSAPDLCSKSECSYMPNKLADRHTVSSMFVSICLNLFLMVL